MSAGVETKIWMAQKARIESMPSPLDDYDVAWPAVLYEASGDPFLRIGRASAEPSTEMIKQGGPSVRRGSLIVTLVIPMANHHEPEVYDYLATIIAGHFKDGTQMRYDDICVTVTNQPHVQAGYDDRNGYWNVPISIPWRTYA